MEVFLWGERCIGMFLLEFFVVDGGLFGWVVFVCWGIFLCKVYDTQSLAWTLSYSAIMPNKVPEFPAIYP